MPAVKWNELNDLIHQCKDTLQIAYVIEIQSRKLRERVGKHLEEINNIILEQADEVN